MRGILDRLKRLRCCSPPSAVGGLVAHTGGGSGEVFVTWDPLPASQRVAVYRLYRRVQTGVWRHLADVTPAAADANYPGKVVVPDFPDNFPGYSDFGTAGERTYVVTALGRSGLEGPRSVEVTGTPP